MSTLTSLETPNLINDRKDGPYSKVFDVNRLNDRSDRTIAFGARDESPTNQYLHSYLENGVFVSVRYVVLDGRKILVSHSSGSIMKAEELIPAILIITATDREFAYKFVDDCGIGFFKLFDPREFPKLPDSETYEAPTLKTLHKPEGYNDNFTSGFASPTLF